MYNNSTHKEFWTFKSSNELKNFFTKTNRNYRVNYCNKREGPVIEDDNLFLTIDEHCKIVQLHQTELLNYCQQQKLPHSVTYTACTYMKRFYLCTSVMEYHPRIMKFVFLWCACKVEEYNITIDQLFKPFQEKQKYANFIKSVVNFELTVMQKLNFNLIVHHPFRPLEGFIIDLKKRSPEFITKVSNLRTKATEFLLVSINTNSMLLYSPSKIAIAALFHAASALGIRLESYFKKLSNEQPASVVDQTYKSIRDIRMQHNNFKPPLNMEKIIMKLESVYCKEKDPTTVEYEIYHQRKKEKKKKKLQLNELGPTNAKLIKYS